MIIKADEMRQAAESNQIKYKEFFEYLDLVAEHKGIKIEEAPLKRLSLFKDFCQFLEDLFKKEIIELTENFKVLELLKKIPDRLKLEERLKSFENLDNYNL